MLPIKIASPASHLKRGYLLAGSLLLVIGLIGQYWWSAFLLPFGLVCLAAISLFVIGLIKHLEPEVSLVLSSNKLTYYHRYGQWSVLWSNVTRVHIPIFTHAIEQREIPYIGIKVEHLECISDYISPRLASRIIHEHRDILALALAQQEASIAQIQINFSPYKFPSGNQITGPLAACLHQMSILEKIYGAHLFIPFSCLSQSPDDIVKTIELIRKRH